MKPLEESKKSQCVRTYINLRLTQEKELRDFKNSQQIQKNIIIKEFKTLKGVSKQRVDYAIKVFKDFGNRDYNKVFDFVLDSLERSFKRHYLNNKDSIINYIKNIYQLQDKLKLFRRNKKKIFNVFKKKACVDLTIVNNLYVKMSSDLKAYNKLGMTFDKFTEYRKEHEFAEVIFSEIFKEEALKIDAVVKQAIIEKEEVNNVIKSMFDIGKSKKDIELEKITELLISMGIK